MFNLSKMSTTELLLFSKTALNNTKNVADIQSAMTEYGFDEEKIDEGIALLNETQALHEAQEQQYGKKYEESDTKKAARKAAEKIYIKYVKLARLAFSDSPARLRHLGIKGRRATDLSDFLKEASQFYNAALNAAEIQAGLSEYGITNAKLTEGKATIDALITSHERQQLAKANAEQSTQVRNDKIIELKEWMSKYIKVSRIAMEETPQLLEALGIVVK